MAFGGGRRGGKGHLRHKHRNKSRESGLTNMKPNWSAFAPCSLQTDQKLTSDFVASSATSLCARPRSIDTESFAAQADVFALRVGGAMAMRVIHYGIDDCYRLTVLRGIGYSVEDCSSLAQLRTALSSNLEADAVFISETEGDMPEAPAVLAKSTSQAPLVLFRHSNRICCEEKFDLIVETLTPPQKWLNDVKALIQRGRRLRARSNPLLQSNAASRAIFNFPHDS